MAKGRTHRCDKGHLCGCPAYAGHGCGHGERRNPESKFDRLEHKIARGERKRHPSYSAGRIRYIAKAAAGKVAREKRAKRR